MSNSKPTDHADYCAQLVLEQDRERLLCVMFAPIPARRALVALLAWNLEVAKVGEIASEEMIGFIRFQWWRDALDEIYDNKPLRQHAVVLELAEAIRSYALPKEPFLEIIAAREADLERAPFGSLEALDSYAVATGGHVLKLWQHVLGVENKDAVEAAEHVGAAWALVGVIRSLHHVAHQGKMRLPNDELKEAGVDADKLLQEGFTPAVNRAVQVVAELAEEHIRDARALYKSMPKQALSPLYLAVQAEDYLTRLKGNGYAPTPTLESGRAKRAFKLWWASVRKRY